MYVYAMCEHKSTFGKSNVIYHAFQSRYLPSPYYYHYVIFISITFQSLSYSYMPATNAIAISSKVINKKRYLYISKERSSVSSYFLFCLL